MRARQALSFVFWLLDNLVRRAILRPVAWGIALLLFATSVAPMCVSARRLELEHCVANNEKFYHGPLSHSSCETWQVLLASQLDRTSPGAMIFFSGLSFVFVALGVRLGGKTAYFVTPKSVLFLRTFAGDERSGDGVSEKPALLEGLSWFESIAAWIMAKRPSREDAEELEVLGPVVLLPRPWQVLRDIGGGSELVLSGDWKRDVKSAFRKCRWIFAGLGNHWGTGFAWELRAIRRLGCHHKLLIKVSSASGWENLHKVKWLCASMADAPANAWQVAPYIRVTSDDQVQFYRTLEDVKNDVTVPRSDLNPPPPPPPLPKFELSPEQMQRLFSHLQEKPRSRR